LQRVTSWRDGTRSGRLLGAYGPVTVSFTTPRQLPGPFTYPSHPPTQQMNNLSVCDIHSTSSNMIRDQRLSVVQLTHNPRSVLSETNFAFPVPVNAHALGGGEWEDGRVRHGTGTLSVVSGPFISLIFVSTKLNTRLFCLHPRPTRMPLLRHHRRTTQPSPMGDSSWLGPHVVVRETTPRRRRWVG
jgi:hypothetical protein